MSCDSGGTLNAVDKLAVAVGYGGFAAGKEADFAATNDQK
jgi:hypothetical protein